MSGDAPGTLTPEIISHALDELWNPSRRAVGPAAPAPQPSCSAAVFKPDESLVLAIRAELITTGTAVHPAEAAHLGRAQGPAPLECAREPGHPGSWHHDGRGTWFR